jgi:hypothetical protein
LLYISSLSELLSSLLLPELPILQLFPSQDKLLPSANKPVPRYQLLSMLLPSTPLLPSSAQVNPFAVRPVLQLPKINIFIFVNSLIKHTLLETIPVSVQYNCIQRSCKYKSIFNSTKVAVTARIQGI